MSETREISLAGRQIGAAHPPYIICELSGNHDGTLEGALRLLEAGAATGADAIKIQSYTPDTITIDHDGPGFRIEGGLWDGRTLYDLYAEAHTPFEWHEAIFAKARELGVTLFSSPFDESAADLLAELGAPAYKIASFEAVDLPLIAHIARKGKPMIISTGMANRQEIGEAVTTARDNGCEDLVLLHCTSSYPAPVSDANVRTVQLLADTFGTIAGLSDHTPGIGASVAAVATGATVIEKHFTLSRADGGPDSDFSLEPDEFASLVTECRNAWHALGMPSFDLQGSERGSVDYRRSLYVVADIAEGGELSKENVRSIRPGYGMAPKYLPDVLGKVASRDLRRGQPLAWEMIKSD